MNLCYSNCVFLFSAQSALSPSLVLRHSGNSIRMLDPQIAIDRRRNMISRKTALASAILFLHVPMALATEPATEYSNTSSPIPVISSPQTSTLTFPYTNPIEPYDTTTQDGFLYQEDIWSRIRSGFSMSDVSQQSIDAQVKKFAAHPIGIERTSERASKYMFHVIEEIEKRNMPAELALLPFIESSFNPNAFSSAKAAGLWQFVPATGLQYNLKQNRFKDERRDVVASTDAALTYLGKLHDMFGDWQLALAAYNWGEGSVQRAIKRNQALGLPTDFDSLAPNMPEETRTYVPKLLAVKEIISNPGKYGVTLPAVTNQPYFTSIQKTQDIDVKVAAELAEMPLKEFKELNPQFNKPVITGDSKTAILLPSGKVEKFQKNLITWGKALTNWTSHSVTHAKERIASIAQKFKTTPEVIRSANNIPPKMEVAVGSTLLVPKLEASAFRGISSNISEATMLSFRKPEPEARSKNSRYKKAPKGDTRHVKHQKKSRA
jgi:membrane-bound lytic murein transglycosylase D